MWTFENDTGNHFHNAVVEFLRHDGRWKVMDSTAVGRIEGPVSFRDLLTELNDSYQVKALVTGKVLTRTVRLGKRLAKVDFTVRSVPDETVIRSFSSFEGSAPLQSPDNWTYWLPWLFGGLCAALALAGTVASAGKIPDTEHPFEGATAGAMGEAGEAISFPDDASHEETGALAVIGALDSFCADNPRGGVINLIKKIMALNTDVEVLLKSKIPDEAKKLHALGTFFKKELVQHIEPFDSDYCEPEAAEQCDLTEEDVEELKQLDGSLVDSLKACLVLYRKLHEILGHGLSNSFGSLGEVEIMCKKLQAKSNRLREEFQQRAELLGQDITEI